MRSAVARTIVAVQALRAAAALSVAFVHIAHDAVANGADPSGAIHWLIKFMPWDAGVDIFFVISGFIIIHASAPLFGGKSGPVTFLRRRVTRIVPLYWLCTLAFLAVLWLGREAIHGDIGGLPYILASFLFIPWPRPDGMMQPAFGLGWTLNYEMFFYVVLTPFLRLARHLAVPIAGLLLVLLVLAGAKFHFGNPQLGFWSSPIILEFCAGMVLAQVCAAGVVLPRAARLVLPILALIILHVCVGLAPAWRPLAYGIPAAALVAAAVLAPSGMASRLGRLSLRLGDASYALYLIHPFIMRCLSVLWHKFHAQNELAGTMYVFVGIIIAQAAALMINRVFEARLTNLLRHRAGVIKIEAV
jgi:peptidoglycan/LPS O-acetylase OafA/YrhL